MLRGAIHVFVRGRCVLFRGSIMYFGVLCQFFIGIHILELYLCIICNFFPHCGIMCLLSALRKDR